MTYTLRHIDDTYRPYEEPIHMDLVRHRDTFEESTTSIDIFKKIIHDHVDPVDYELTEENIQKEFKGIKPEGIKQALAYYTVRKEIYEEMIKWVDECDTENLKEREDFHFIFPKETDKFSMNGIISDTEKINEHSIELIIDP